MFRRRKYFNSQRCWLFLLIICLMNITTPGYSFRLSGSGARGAPVAPHVWPPFSHWDLREFPDCIIPYSFHDGTADMPGLPEFNSIANAFERWQGVTPAIIAFELRVPPAGAKKPLNRDNNNMIGFSSRAGSPIAGALPRYTLAITATLRNHVTGVIIEAEILFNDEDYQWDNANFALRVVSSGPCPEAGFPMVAGQSLTVRVDQAAEQTIMFPAGPLTVGVVRNEINAQITGARARVYREGGNWRVHIFSDNRTGSGRIEITGGTANPALGFPLGEVKTMVADVESVASHEIGHFIGLKHTQLPAAGAATPTMFGPNPVPFEGNTNARSLENDDEDGCNFLYNLDLGDAPPFDNAYSAIFSTLVHSTTPSRQLNGKQLFTPWPGPDHMFGIKPRQPARNYTYEWLGGDLTPECEANIINVDPNDDGVLFLPIAPIPGFPLLVEVHVNTGADVSGNGHDYAAHPMFLNVWMDLNVNSAWETPVERIIHTPMAGPGIIWTFVVYPLTLKPVWLRARLDWGEDVGGVARIDPTLALHEGAAQFGEVEDYPLRAIPFIGQPLYDYLYVAEYWTFEGTPLDDVEWAYTYQVSGMQEPEIELVTGTLRFREIHPELNGMDVILGYFLPYDSISPPTDWREIVWYSNGTADLMGVNMTGPPWEYQPLSDLPETHWRVPVLVPAPGGKTSDTIYTAINLNLYYDQNPLWFDNGNWNVGQTISELDVEIIDGTIPGVDGIYFATTPFEFDQNSPVGFTASGGSSTLLNSISYPYDIIIIKEKGDSIPQLTYDVPPVIRIEKTHRTYQGHYEYVSITIEDTELEMGGFDLLIAYDASALTAMEITPGQLLEDCDWEYFTYRFGADGNCGDACPSGLLRIIAIAEMNDGVNHPSCYGPPDADPHEMAEIRFLVTNDRTFECQYVPIYFFWGDCGDNSIASIDGETLYIDRAIYDFKGDLIWDEEDDDQFPEDARIPFVGAPDYCLNPDPDKPSAVRFIDFINGGIDIICADSIDVRGDINLNGVANEIADAVVFTNYFIYGLAAFTVNQEGQIAATDVNADGMVLSVADLTYLIRVIIGDALPYAKLSPVTAKYDIKNGVLSIDREMGAAYVVIKREVTPVNLTDNMEMKYAYDSENDVTKVLLYSMEKNQKFQGDFLELNGTLIEVEMATYEGATVKLITDLLPQEFILHQNKPNPFNPLTDLSFSLPMASDVTLEIYNITGQKVATVVEDHFDVGTHTVHWDGSDYASGIYMYRITAGDFTDSKKMLLLK